MIMAKKKIVVNLALQSVTAYEDGKVFRVCECVSGDADHPTPTGGFAVKLKYRKYTSRKYKAPMDYAMFFTTTGEALHKYHGPAPWWMLRAGRALTDWVGSHGCVRLQEDDAMALFKWAAEGTPVEVF